MKKIRKIYNQNVSCTYSNYSFQIPVQSIDILEDFFHALYEYGVSMDWVVGYLEKSKNWRSQL